MHFTTTTTNKGDIRASASILCGILSSLLSNLWESLLFSGTLAVLLIHIYILSLFWLDTILATYFSKSISQIVKKKTVVNVIYHVLSKLS